MGTLQSRVLIREFATTASTYQLLQLPIIILISIIIENSMALTTRGCHLPVILKRCANKNSQSSVEEVIQQLHRNFVMNLKFFNLKTAEAIVPVILLTRAI